MQGPQLIRTIMNLTECPFTIWPGTPLDTIQAVPLAEVRIAAVSLGSPLTTPILPQLPDVLSPDEMRSLQQLLLQCQYIFALIEDNISHTHLADHSIHTECPLPGAMLTAEPLCLVQRR